MVEALQVLDGSQEPEVTLLTELTASSSPEMVQAWADPLRR
ncbi:hypothetical protein ACIRQP_24015 [Streptomyces sp. NPDC102274]